MTYEYRRKQKRTVISAFNLKKTEPEKEEIKTLKSSAKKLLQKRESSYVFKMPGAAKIKQMIHRPSTISPQVLEIPENNTNYLSVENVYEDGWSSLSDCDKSLSDCEKSSSF